MPQGHIKKQVTATLTGVVAGSHLIVLGSTCRLYCLDTQTGKLLWLVSEGERHQWMEAMRKKCLEDGTIFNHGNRQDYDLRQR